MTPPKHVNFHAKKLFGEMGRIVDGSVAYIELDGGGPTELHTHEHNHLFIVTEGAKFVDYLKKKEIKTNFLIAFTVKNKTRYYQSYYGTTQLYNCHFFAYFVVFAC